MVHLQIFNVVFHLHLDTVPLIILPTFELLVSIPEKRIRSKVVTVCQILAITSLQVSPRSISPWPANCPEPLPPPQACKAAHTCSKESTSGNRQVEIASASPFNEFFGWNLMDADPFQSILYLVVCYFKTLAYEDWWRIGVYPLPGEIKGVGVVILNPHLAGCQLRSCFPLCLSDSFPCPMGRCHPGGCYSEILQSSTGHVFTHSLTHFHFHYCSTSLPVS